MHIYLQIFLPNQQKSYREVEQYQERWLPSQKTYSEVAIFERGTN